MTDPKNIDPGAALSHQQTAKAERLAEQLRENLRRRKAQARAQKDSDNG